MLIFVMFGQGGKLRYSHNIGDNNISRKCVGSVALIYVSFLWCS